MTIENLGVKLYSGTKSDRKSDSLGSSADGTNTGIKNPNYSSNGLEFTGGEYVEVNGLRSTISGATSISMACWINPSDITDATILGFWNSGYEVIIFSINGSNKLQLVTKGADGSNLYMASSASISADTLAHVAFTYDTSGTDTVKLYINGALDSTHTTNVPTSFPSSSTGNVYIGSHSAGTNYFDGTIKQYLVYSDVLTLTEIQTLYNSGTPVTSPSTSGLVSRYDFTANANDSQGSNNGTSSAIKLGTGAYSFDGSDDYVSIDDSSANLIQGRSSAWTIAGWLKRDGSTDKYFISQWGKNSSPDNRVFHIGIDSNGKLLYRQRTDGGQGASFTSNGAIVNNTWTHFAIVWQPNGSNWQAQMYINGTADNSKTDFANDMRGGSIAEPVYLGKNGSDATAPSAGGDHFNGELDDLAVWHRALTATEIGKLANNNDSPFTHTGDQNSYGTTSIANNSLVLDSNSGSGQTASPVAVRDLGTLGSSWCVRWSVYAPTQSESISGKNSFARFGFSDKGTYSSSEGLNNVTDKAILWNWHLGTSLLKNMTYTGGSGTNNGGQSISYADDTTWYWEMKYDGSTVTITRYNSDYSSAQVTADTISVSGYTGMNYLVIGQPRDHANGTWKLRFDNIKIWNNQSSATGDPDFTFEFDNNTDGGDAQLVSSLSNTAGLKVYYPLDSNANNSATAGEGQLTTSLADQTKLSAYYNMDTAPSGAELDDDFSSYANPVSYTHLTLPTNREV